MKFIILGCGSSMGVPRADGFYGNCDPKNKKNYRTRCSAIFFLPLLGTGDKKGLSVSINNFSLGILQKVSCNSNEFLNVIIPLAEK